MSHDPLRDAFERMAPRQVSPGEARDRLTTLSPGFRSARRNHRIRTGIAGVTAAVALTVGGPVAIAAIAPGSSAPIVDFASPDDSTDDTTDQQTADDSSTNEGPETDTSSASGQSPDGATDTADVPDDDDASSDDGEGVDHSADVLGEGASTDAPTGDGSDDDDDDDDESSGDSESGDDDSDDGDDDSDDDDSDSDSDDDDDEDDESDSPVGEAVVEGVTYTKEGPAGTLSVRVVDGVIEYVGSTTLAGFEVDIDTQADEIRADFHNESGQYRIEAEYEHDQLFWTID